MLFTDSSGIDLLGPVSFSGLPDESRLRPEVPELDARSLGRPLSPLGERKLRIFHGDVCFVLGRLGVSRFIQDRVVKLLGELPLSRCPARAGRLHDFYAGPICAQRLKQIRKSCILLYGSARNPSSTHVGLLAVERSAWTLGRQKATADNAVAPAQNRKHESLE